MFFRAQGSSFVIDAARKKQEYSMTDPLVLVAQEGAVRTITLNRPKSLNAFTSAMHEELAAALDAAKSDVSVRCLVLTGAGRAFCAGQDLADPAVAPNLVPGGPPTDVGNVIARRRNASGL